MDKEAQEQPKEKVVDVRNGFIYQGQTLVLSDVSVTMESGEFVYLIGKTGSGKSSFLKTLYGDLPLAKGDGFVAGMELNKLKRKDIPVLRRKLGIVFQDFQLQMDRTVSDNLKFVLSATGWTSKKDIQMRIYEVLTEVVLKTKGFKIQHEQ